MFVIMITLVPRSVESAPFISSQNKNTDQNYDEYVMFDTLEKALVHSPFNIHQLKKTFYSGDLVLCLPVAYEIYCSLESNDTWDFNCTSYTMTFLWTYFDTEAFAGRVLLYFTKNHLKSPLFTIRHKFCEYSQSTCGITLYLELDGYPVLTSNISLVSLLTTTLLDITKKVCDQICKVFPDVHVLYQPTLHSIMTNCSYIVR